MRMVHHCMEYRYIPTWSPASNVVVRFRLDFMTFFSKSGCKVVDTLNRKLLLLDEASHTQFVVVAC